MPAISYTKTGVTDVAWDAGANVKRLPAAKAALRACHAWVDGSGDADAKSSYKFPHHQVGSDGKVGAANTRACSAIIAALNGGRGGANIPDKDRSGVHAHAAGHLKAAGKDVPELKSLEQIEAESRQSGEVERRVFKGSVTLKRDAAVEGMPKIQGYAAVFDQETLIGSASWGFREKIAQGAFTEAIQNDDVRGLFNHDENHVLGRNTSGTLRLAEDETGLHYEIDPPDTGTGRDLVNLIGRGDIDGSSFGFIVTQDQWEYPTQDQPGVRPLRTVQKVQLFDVSPVTYPAYPQTTSTISARAKSMATAQAAARPAAGTRDGSTNGGSSGDVGGDVGGMDASKAAIQKTMRAVKQFQKASRAMVKALDISHGFNPSGGDLTGPGGSSLDTGTGRSAHKARKQAAKAVRDRLITGTRDDSSANDVASATMYYSSRSLRRLANAANHTMNCMRAMCSASGMDLSDGDGGGAADSAPGGDGSAMGSDAGSAGANKAVVDLDLRRRRLELERLR